jgi:hypothetical protein
MNFMHQKVKRCVGERGGGGGEPRYVEMSFGLVYEKLPLADILRPLLTYLFNQLFKAPSSCPRHSVA